MHTLILNAAPSGERCRAALPRLHLPHLQQLLGLLSPTAVVRGAATDLTPVHEHVLAASVGIDSPDGLIPWAAHDAAQLGLPRPGGNPEAPNAPHAHQAEPQTPGAWAWITPCHWTVHTDHVHMDDPHTLALTARDAEVLFRDMQPYFLEDGITLYASHVGLSHSHWLAHGAVFANLPTASLSRVAGQVVDPWMPRQPQAQSLRRLQNEMQMLLYTHPVNDARANFRLPSVNAFWVSGTGALPVPPNRNVSAGAPAAPAQECHVRNALQWPALHDDASAWVQAWEALDASTLAHELQRLQQGQPVHITLCGSDSAQTFAPQALSPWARLLRRLRPLQAVDVLNAL
ncbi:MAG: phosphoglycerate mutase [Burkholderiales bacterium]|nr:phosphoglycerate mutase [Burkholderiales bacterium]